MPRTRYLILRKTPYQDSSLIVAGISPEFGRLDFLLKGARSLSSKRFPSAELFRELTVEFREPGSRSSGLFALRSHEPLAQNDGVAANLDTYFSACHYAAFLLQQSRPMLEAPAAYHAFRLMLRRMAQTGKSEPWRTLALLAFLNEAGFLPESRSFEGVSYLQRDRRSALLGQLLEYAVSDDESSSLPELSEAYWRKLTSWADALCLYQFGHTVESGNK